MIDVRELEDIPSYIKRNFNKLSSAEILIKTQQIIGSVGPYKEGDKEIGVAALNEESRQFAVTLLNNTRISFFQENPLYQDRLQSAIWKNINLESYDKIKNWSFKELKEFLLNKGEENIKAIINGLNSDSIASVVKLMSNEELISVGKKIFNPLDGSNIGAKGYLSARIQPNSPTDSPEDVRWQVFNAWAYAVGDLMLGNNPSSSIPSSVLGIENTLKEIIEIFELSSILPWSVLAHVDIQAQLEKDFPESTALWFQSIAGTESANEVFGISLEKMLQYAKGRSGIFGMYFETGQGADFTNGQDHGVDMGTLESRKYGFAKLLQEQMPKLPNGNRPWVPVNDVAGFIGPEVFRTREQLVRVALEDTLMGKLHGLTIGLDICSTFHMSVSPNDIRWCIDEIMPINPAFIMALPSRQDPMLSYLSTSIHDHLHIREKFGLKINEAMTAFFKDIEILDEKEKPTSHFGDPIWIYLKFQKRKGDSRPDEIIYEEGRQISHQVRSRGIILVSGYEASTTQTPIEVERYIDHVYENAKKSLYSEITPVFLDKFKNSIKISTTSLDRDDYILHPTTGEFISNSFITNLEQLKEEIKSTSINIQIIISDGLNANAITDEGHVLPFIEKLKTYLQNNENYKVAPRDIIIKNGRVRAGYQIGEIIFGDTKEHINKSIIHVIGERPGTEHNNFSVYLTTASQKNWATAGHIDHSITYVVSGVSDTALIPEIAIKQVLGILLKSSHQ